MTQTRTASSPGPLAASARDCPPARTDGMPWRSSTGRDGSEAVAATSGRPGGSAIGVGIDVTDAEQVEAGFRRVADDPGPPVVLVNNAGILRDNLISG